MSSPRASYSPRESTHWKDFDSSNTSENETLLGCHEKSSSVPDRQGRRLKAFFKVSLTIFNVVVLMVNAIGLLLLASKDHPLLSKFGLNGRCVPLDALSPSPAQEALHYQLHRFEDVTPDSVLVNGTGHETDRAWGNLVDNGKWFAVDEATFTEVNGNPDTGLRLPGENNDKFIGMLQVNHQLHCVDILRQSTWYNIEHYRHRHHFHHKTDDQLVEHAKHCVEILRQTVQCHGDTALLTFNWVRGHAWPQAATKSLHSCQNWDVLNEWRANNDVSHLTPHLERPAWVMNPDPLVQTPGHGHRGAAEVAESVVCEDWECGNGFLGPEE